MVGVAGSGTNTGQSRFSSSQFVAQPDVIPFFSIVGYGTLRAEWITSLEVVLMDGSVIRTKGTNRARKSISIWRVTASHPIPCSQVRARLDGIPLDSSLVQRVPSESLLRSPCDSLPFFPSESPLLPSRTSLSPSRLRSRLFDKVLLRLHWNSSTECLFEVSTWQICSRVKGWKSDRQC